MREFKKHLLRQKQHKHRRKGFKDQNLLVSSATKIHIQISARKGVEQIIVEKRVWREEGEEPLG